MEVKDLQQQLRIGNFLHDRRYRLCKVKELGVGTIYAPAIEGSITSIPNKPIMLTEGWLLKMGFEFRSDGKYYHKKFDRSWVKIDSIITKYYGNASGNIVMIDYVHQLQNTFYIMTGEELTINEGK